MAAFYRQFGWPESPTSVFEHVVFRCSNGVVLGLFSESRFERQFGPLSEGVRGFTLTIHCEDEEAVIRAHEQLRGFDDVTDPGLGTRPVWVGIRLRLPRSGGQRLGRRSQVWRGLR